MKIGVGAKLGLLAIVLAGVIYLFISVVAPPLFSHAPKKVLVSSSQIVQTVQVEVIPLFDTIMKLYDKILVAVASTVSTVVLIRDKLRKTKDVGDTGESKPKKKKSKFY